MESALRDRPLLRRIFRLFRPYRRELWFIAGLIVITSGLGVVSPLLLKVVFDRALFVSGGPRLGLERLKLHLDLSAAMLGLALMMDAPTLVLTRLPEAVEAKGPLDPVMFRNEVARSFLHVFKAFLSLWRRHDFGAGLDRMLALEAT